MPRPLSETELRWIVPRIRSVRRSLRLGWSAARWVFRGLCVLCLVLGIGKFLDDGSWGALLGLGLLGVLVGALSFVLPTGDDGEADPEEGDSLQAHWIRGPVELVRVGSGKTATWVHAVGGIVVAAPGGWTDDLRVGEPVEVEVVAASTPGLDVGRNATFWLVAIRGRRSLQAELEAGVVTGAAELPAVWWALGGAGLAVALVVLLASGFPWRAVHELPAAWAPRPIRKASPGSLLPEVGLRPGDPLELGPHFAFDEAGGPEEGIALLPWRPAQRDSFLVVVRGLQERRLRARAAADTAQGALFAFAPWFDDPLFLEHPETFDAWDRSQFPIDWRRRRPRRMAWLASLDTLLPGDTAWTSWVQGVRRQFEAIDSSGGDPDRGREGALSIHASILALLHPDSAEPLANTENAILDTAWVRSLRGIFGISLVSDGPWSSVGLGAGVWRSGEFSDGAILPAFLRSDNRWLLHPDGRDDAVLEAAKAAFRPAGARAVWCRRVDGWAVVRPGEPLRLADLARDLGGWGSWLLSLWVWIVGGRWLGRRRARSVARARAVSQAWWVSRGSD